MMWKAANHHKWWFYNTESIEWLIWCNVTSASPHLHYYLQNTVSDLAKMALSGNTHTYIPPLSLSLSHTHTRTVTRTNAMWFDLDSVSWQKRSHSQSTILETGVCYHPIIGSLANQNTSITSAVKLGFWKNARKQQVFKVSAECLCMICMSHEEMWELDTTAEASWLGATLTTTRNTLVLK